MGKARYRRQRILREHAVLDELGYPVRCPNGGKVTYGRVIDAWWAGKGLADPDRPLAPYRCPNCLLFHLTSGEPRWSVGATPAPRMATVARILLGFPDGAVAREALGPARWGINGPKRLRLALRGMEVRRLIRREQEGEWIVVLDRDRLLDLAIDGCPD